MRRLATTENGDEDDEAELEREAAYRYVANVMNLIDALVTGIANAKP